jgi:hypothetical protein
MVYLSALALILGVGNPCSGQGFKKLGSTGMKFLDIDASVRSAALGGASNSLFDGAASLFQNPAGIADVPALSMYVGTNTWIADISQYSLAAVIHMNKIGLSRVGGTLGFSMVYMDNGDMIRTDYNQVAQDMSYYVHDDPYTISEWAFGVAYARRITDQFAFGGQVKQAVQDFGEIEIYRYYEEDTVMTSTKLAPWIFDFGTIFHTGFKDLRISMSFRNFSEELIYVREKFELPISMKIGIAMNVFGMAEDNHSLTIAMDAVHPRDYTERLNLGMEYKYKVIALRAGYKFNHDEEGFSAGFGLEKTLIGSTFRFNYAYSAFGVFGAVQRFSVSISS